MDLVEGIKQFGFPIAVAAYFIFSNGKNDAEHKKDLRDVAAKSIQALDASTSAINEQIKESVRNTAALDANKAILDRVGGILSMKGNQDGGI